jgi:hypothetical protein
MAVFNRDSIEIITLFPDSEIYLNSDFDDDGMVITIRNEFMNVIGTIHMERSEVAALLMLDHDGMN